MAGLLSSYLIQAAAYRERAYLLSLGGRPNDGHKREAYDCLRAARRVRLFGRA